MGSYCSLLMGSFAAFSCGCSPIQRTILKSQCRLSCYRCLAYQRLSRILLACIRFLGRCPCPRCLVTKTNISKLGKKFDMCFRAQNIRVDNQHLQNKIDRVREWIYAMGKGVKSAWVERELSPQSWVPTRVSLLPGNKYYAY